jgi:hypothetical protein
LKSPKETWGFFICQLLPLLLQQPWQAKDLYQLSMHLNMAMAQELHDEFPNLPALLDMKCQSADVV